MSAARTQPWYREPWPWILMAGPAIVVVAIFAVAPQTGAIPQQHQPYPHQPPHSQQQPYPRQPQR